MELSEKQKKEIIQRIYNHIHIENNGYCRVGWAIKQVMGKDFKSDNDEVLKLQLANLAIKTNKYRKDRSHKDYYDFDISVNTNYTWASTHPLLFYSITAIITAILSVISSLISVHFF